MMTGSAGLSRQMRSRTVMPSMPGMRRSSTTTSHSDSERNFRAAAPSCAVETSMLRFRRTLAMDLAKRSSSSVSSTRMGCVMRLSFR